MSEFRSDTESNCYPAQLAVSASEELNPIFLTFDLPFHVSPARREIHPGNDLFYFLAFQKMGHEIICSWGNPWRVSGLSPDILFRVRVDNTALGLEIYIQVPQTCLLLEGCPGQCAGSESGLIDVGLCEQNIFHSEGWILGIQTQRIPAIGATPLRNHQKKMDSMSNMIKSNAHHAAMCVACWAWCFHHVPVPFQK